MDKQLDIFKKILADAKKSILKSNNSVINNRDNIQTKADIVSQENIINALKKYKISCKLYSEELNEPLLIGDGRYEIILDPLDGSFMFLHGIQAFTSIAMMVLENRNVKYALVQSIDNKNLYYCDHMGAYLNGKKMECRLNDAEEPYLITGFAAKKKRLDHISALKELSSNFYFIGDGGPLFSAMVASNKIDAAIEFSPTSFNELAGAIIAQKAGALVETINGNPITLDPLIRQTLIVARSEKLLKDLQRVLKH